MGLAERRGVHDFDAEQFPTWRSRIAEAAGFEVPVEVLWDELAVPDFADSYPEAFGKVYFEPLVAALTDVTRDDLGKAAVRDGLTKVVIRNTEQYSSSAGFGFAGGVLTLDHRPQVNVDYVDDRTRDLVKVLESGL
jgi:hypothetical protein